MDITEPQHRALKQLAKASSAPSEVGWAMVEGRDLKSAKRGSPQGLGRIGGAMCRRLIQMGLAEDLSSTRDGFSLYGISHRGRQIIAQPNS